MGLLVSFKDSLWLYNVTNSIKEACRGRMYFVLMYHL